MMVLERIYFGGGCFWCTEAAFKRLSGVVKVTPGYSGGSTASPTYAQVCSGRTGHAEVVEVEFDTRLVSLRDLLDVFFQVHDPTTHNQQGSDVGTQYRSVIFYTSGRQKKAAQEYIKKIQPKYGGKIVTELKKIEAFYVAEEYHKDYFAKNPLNPYCLFVIRPKLGKIKQRPVPLG